MGALLLFINVLTQVETLLPAAEGIAGLAQSLLNGGTVTPEQLTVLQNLSVQLNTQVQLLEQEAEGAVAPSVPASVAPSTPQT